MTFLLPCRGRQEGPEIRKELDQKVKYISWGLFPTLLVVYYAKGTTLDIRREIKACIKYQWKMNLHARSTQNKSHKESRSKSKF